MASISVGAALGLGAAGSVAGSLISSNAATSAANTQAQADEQAAKIQEAEFNRVQASLKPYNTGGQQAFSDLQKLTGTNKGGNPLSAALTKPFAPTMASLAATPGYQFALTQGQQATQNSYAAQGLGQSGAALKGAANYSEGLASTTYQQQFQNYLAQNQQIANILGGQANLGENAAATAGNTGAAITNSITGATTGAAAATAAGTVGSANALSAGLGSLSNTGTLLALGNNSGLFGSSSGSGGSGIGDAIASGAAG